MSVESTIYYCSRVFVFDLRNVPNNNGLGFKAIDFTKNPHMWAGQLRINSGQTPEGEDAHSVVLEHDPSDPAGKSGVFARCEAKPEAIMAALDSSRYFVLRIYNQTGQFVQIAVGFNNKNDAFDFRHELSVLTQKKQQLTTLLPQGEGQDLTLKTNISLDINNLRPNNNQQPSDAQRSQFVSRPTNVEKVSLNAQQHQVRGRNRTGGGGGGGVAATTTATTTTTNIPQQQPIQQQQQQQPIQQPPQQSTQNKTSDPFDFADFGKALSQTTAAPQQTQQQPKYNNNNNNNNNTTNIDIFSTLAPPSQPQQQASPSSQQQQQQQQQSNASSGGLLDNFFSSDHSVKQSVTKENNAAPQQPKQPTTTAQKKTDLFDFDDNDFNF